MYRVIIAGAMYTTAYMEPFIIAKKENDDGFLGRMEYKHPFPGQSMNEQPPVTSDDLERIRSYPVYTFDPDMESSTQTDRELYPSLELSQSG